MSALLLSFLFVLQVLGAKQQPNLSTQAVAKCTIAGAVTDAGTGQPLDKAEITLFKVGERAQPHYAVTDAGGQFEISNIDPGRYSMNASHAGYVGMQYGQKEPGGPRQILTLRAGEKMTDISFRLIHEAVITGHVYDQDGDAIERAQINALQYRYFRGKRQLMASAFVTTDDRGEFRLFDLAPGEYYISASSHQPTFESVGGTSYSTAYYPGVSDPSSAEPITVGPGDVFPGVDFSLQSVATFHIRGRVTNSVTTASPGMINVMVTSTGTGVTPYFFGGNVRDKQGDFDISNVVPGSYDVIVRLFDHGKMYEARQSVQVVDSDINGLNLVIGSGVTLQGRVQTEGSVDISKLDVSLEPRGISFGPNSASSVKSDGAFELDNIFDGTYTVRVWPLTQNAYLKSVTLDGQDVLESGFEVQNGQASGSMLDITLSANGGRVGGVVMKDGKPFNDARVTLVPADKFKLSEDIWFKETTTDQYGDFSIQGIRPGEYRAFAWEQIEPGESRDPNFLARFEDKGQKVEVTENSTAHLQLEAIPATETQAAGE